MKVRLNLSTQPLESSRRFVAGATLIGTVALVALVGLSLNVYHTWRGQRSERQEVARLERELDQLRSQRRELENYFNAAQTHKVTDRSAFINSLIDQRSFPWTKVFTDLEHTLPEGVRVVSISQRMDKGRVEITLVVGAASDEGKLKFLKALEESPSFSGVEVKSESRPNRPGESDRVQMELVTWYATT
jgi:Tfp pilus assembly protein PilN